MADHTNLMQQMHDGTIARAKTQRARIAALEQVLLEERAILNNLAYEAEILRGNVEILKGTIAANEKTIASLRELAELHGAKFTRCRG